MTSKIIKMILAYKDLNISSLAEKLETSRPNLSQKIKRDNFSEKELQDIATALNCDLKIMFVDRDTGKEFN
ncbi:MAG: helix-turn-helix domain-containing protein [Lachnospiraceae bacterium]|nr:helix-turn-helix domain-containing protein [Lachnospiraceae bacterium]MBD5509971.1 helix-turn-helix domain-containing protein [Lachnospiraceae bacterium]